MCGIISLIPCWESSFPNRGLQICTSKITDERDPRKVNWTRAGSLDLAYFSWSDPTPPLVWSAQGCR